MPVELFCNTCKSRFVVPPSQSQRKYCCRKCQPFKGEGNPNWKGGLADRVCLNCRSAFQVKQKEVKAGRGIFCSRSCSSSYRSRERAKKTRQNRVQKKCITCSTPIFVKPSHKDVEGTFCSRDCMAKGYAESLSGESNPNYRHGQAYTTSFYSSQRRSAEGKYSQSDIDKIEKNQKGKCANCLASLKKTGRHIDHIMPIYLGGSNWPHNLQILCPSCNCRKHAKHPIDWAQENGRLL